MTVAITILGLVATVLAVTALANRIRFSAPLLLLMLVGIGISFPPLVPIPELSAELVLIGLLPPLAVRRSHPDVGDRLPRESSIHSSFRYCSSSSPPWALA